MKLVDQTIEYVKGSYSEMKKVVWPTRKQTITYSMIVIAMSIGTAVFFGVLDYFFNIGLEAIISGDNQAPISAPAEHGAEVPATSPADFGAEGVGIETEPTFSTKSAE